MELHFSLPLQEPPVPVALGIGVHGVQSRTDRYLLPELWCLHLYGYRGTLLLNGETLPIRPGFAGLTPPGHPVVYRYEGRSTHLYVHFRCGPSSESAALSRVPAMQDLGDRFPAFYAALEEVVLQPTLPAYRRQARLWDLLGQLAEPAPTRGATTGLHPAVQQTVERIERGLGEPLRVSQLAFDAGVSYSYLSRLFQAELGSSVIGYIAARRMEKAQLLLTQSTLPIKTVASAVGMPDLHLFNKTVRRSLGVSPRALRLQALKNSDASEG